MSLETFIQAMPKIDVNVQFEGSISRETILRVADQNDIISTMKQREYNEWTGYLTKPDYKKVDDIARVHAGWLKYPEDLSHAIYDLGVMLYKQHVRYAEVHISPAIYTDGGLTYEQFLDAINDGRDKALRGWKVKMDWVLTIPRDRPRKGDDVSRWATSAFSRKGNVIGVGISGREDLQPSEQFMKPLEVVKRKDMPISIPARTMPNAEPLNVIVSVLHPTRITDAWGIVSDPEALKLLVEQNISVVVTPTRELRLGRIASAADYPIQPLLADVPVAISGNMSEIYRTTLTDELLNLAKGGLGIEDVEKLMLNAIEMSFMAPENKEAMRGEFKAEFERLHSEHLAV